eukprot:358130-Chlamydomonas_euryale.AAC.4
MASLDTSGHHSPGGGSVKSFFGGGGCNSTRHVTRRPCSFAVSAFSARSPAHARPRRPLTAHSRVRHRSER